ncbi:pilus assembly PilX N-terminal domain-containing protein [candidate division TA06 bacterium]|nr:pilus assembly PilX N-terminal domain-containing protein [candidate division TA06 bacterium]
MKNIIKQEKGIALVISLMLILVMSVMVAGFMLTITNEQKMGGNQVRYIEALNVAEAGISEAAARIGVGTSSANFIGEGTNPGSASWQAKLVDSDDLPTAASGSNVVYYSSIQPDGSGLQYSVSQWDNNPDTIYALTVRYKTDEAGTGIYYYNHATGAETLVVGPSYSAPSLNHSPVYIARSTGMVGNVRRSVEVNLTQQRFTFATNAAVACDAGVFKTGFFCACGHNHSINTPWGTGVKKGANQFPCIPYELCDPNRTPAGDSAAGCLKAITTSGDVIDQPGNGNNGGAFGYPEPLSTTEPPLKQIWEIFGFADSIDFKNAFTFRTVNSVGELGGDPNGFVEFNCDVNFADVGATQVHGIWWIKGNFFAGSEQFKGLIYAESDCDMTGKFWILGALLAKGDVTLSGVGQPRGRGMHFRGNADVLYSSEAVSQELSNSSNSGLKQLAWREVNIH